MRMTPKLSNRDFDLYGVHGARSEGCVREGLSGTQQVANGLKIMLVLLDGLNPQTVPWQHCFVAWSVSRRWEELKIPMTPSEKKPQPCIGSWKRRQQLHNATCKKSLFYSAK